ncbi:MAG: phosphatase PAP2 family protein [Clostridiales bacterium]|nr:phosphatase PAP2 family protein [Clostridiales bacterium]
MKSNKTKTIPAFAALALVWLAALVFASIYDLNISLTIADPMSGFGRALEIIGEPPAILFTSFNCALIIYYFLKKPNRARRDITLAALSFIGMYGAAFYTIYQTFRYIAEYRSDVSSKVIETGALEIILSVVICTAVCAIMLFGVSKLKYETLCRVSDTAVRCVFAAITTLVVIWCFKLVWGRVRFRQLDGDYTRFTPWYHPNGFTGYFSFPSGHTANAAVIFTAIYYLDFLPEKHKKLKPIIYLMLVLWILLLAFSRVAVGAHYLSDVLFGAAITFAIVYFWKPKNNGKR